MFSSVLSYHPDNIENDGDKELCNRQMMVINGAYRILKNPALRILYDKQRIRGLYGIKSGITERSATGVGSSSSASSAPPRPEPKPQPKPRPKPSNEDVNSAGFGGSWSTTDDAYNRERERERAQERERQAQYEESAYRRAERIRQERAKEWEDAGGQPQPQRQRVDGYSDDSASSSSASSSSSRSSNSRSDEPIRSSERDRGSNALNEVEEFLRSTGSRVSSELESLISSMKSKLEKLRLRKSELERNVYSDTRDWGEVTDMSLIKKRLMDINDLKLLNQQVTEMEEEIADIMLRGRTTANSGGNSRTTRPPVDLWGDPTTGSRPREEPPQKSPYRGGARDANRPPPPPPPPPRKRKPLDSEGWDKYFEEDGWGFGGGGSSSSGNDLDKAMWRNRRGPNHRGGGGGGGGGGNQRASMSGADIGNVGAVNVGGKLLCNDETETNVNSDRPVEIRNNRGIYDCTFDAKSTDTAESSPPGNQYPADNPNIAFDEICRLFRRHVQRPSSP